MFGSTESLSALEKIRLEYLIEKQEILDGNLQAGNEEIRLLQAAAGFEEDLLNYQKDQIKLKEEAAKKAEDERKKAQKKAEDERKKLEQEEKRRLEADPGFQMKKQLEEMLKLENQVAAGATAIGNAFANSFKGVVTGSKTAQEALADMMASVAEHFLDMAAKIIAQQLAMILYGTIMKSLGVSMGGGGGFGSGDEAPLTSNLDFSSALADGGYVDKPTRAVLGERESLNM